MSRNRLITVVSTIVAVAGITVFGALAQGVKIMDIEELPEKPTKIRPKKQPDLSNPVIKFDQLPAWHNPNGELLYTLHGKKHGFEQLSFVVTETHPGGGPFAHTHATEEAHIILQGKVKYWTRDPKTLVEQIRSVQGPFIFRIPQGLEHTFINDGDELINVIGVFPDSSVRTQGVGPNPLVTAEE